MALFLRTKNVTIIDRITAETFVCTFELKYFNLLIKNIKKEWDSLQDFSVPNWNT